MNLIYQQFLITLISNVFMCLITKNGIKVASEDIPFFKLAIKIGNRYYSPYKKSLIGIKPSGDDIVVYNELCQIFSIGQGFIHGFTTPNAPYLKFVQDFITKNNIVIIKGFIPKGTDVYFNELDEICAKQVKYEFLQNMNLFKKLWYFLGKKYLDFNLF